MHVYLHCNLKKYLYRKFQLSRYVKFVCDPSLRLAGVRSRVVTHKHWDRYRSKLLVTQWPWLELFSSYVTTQTRVQTSRDNDQILLLLLLKFYVRFFLTCSNYTCIYLVKHISTSVLLQLGNSHIWDSYKRLSISNISSSNSGRTIRSPPQSYKYITITKQLCGTNMVIL